MEDIEEKDVLSSVEDQVEEKQPEKAKEEQQPVKPKEFEPEVPAREWVMTMREWHRDGFLAWANMAHPGKRLTAAGWRTICQEYLARPVGQAKKES